MNRDEHCCRVCNIELTDDNWYPSIKKLQSNICIVCEKKYREKYRRSKGINFRKIWDGKCRVCHIILTTDNWNTSNKKSGNYICRSCLKEKMKIYRMNLSKEKIAKLNEKSKTYLRKNYITTIDGLGKKKTIRCFKRPHTLICELCSREMKRTIYHHWDDDNPELGMWVCQTCHVFCEKVESGIHEENYLELKRKIKNKEI